MLGVFQQNIFQDRDVTISMDVAFPLVLDALWDSMGTLWDTLISPAIESWRNLQS